MLSQADCWSGSYFVRTGKEQHGIVKSKALGCGEEETDPLLLYLFLCEFSSVSIDNG